MPVRLTAQTGAARDHDDAPVPPLIHPRRHGPAGVEGAPQVDVHDGVPVGVRQVLERLRCLPHHAASHLHEHVDGPDPADQRIHRRTAGDVERGGLNQAPDVGSHPLQRFRQDVRCDHAGTTGGEALDDATFDAPATPVTSAVRPVTSISMGSGRVVAGIGRDLGMGRERVF